MQARGSASSAPDDLEKRLAASIKAHRLGLGLTQEDFAERLGVHRTYVSKLERGMVSITLLALERLAQQLGVAPVDLLRSPSEP